jgi:iron complex outermembrane receptor protein
MKPPRYPLGAALLWASLVPAAAALAQTVPPVPAAAAPSAPPPPVELSPFVISEASETGWIATETLAGSRLRTNFKDIPNQIETLTMDFMADLGVTTLDQALIYTANVENYTDFMPQTPGNQVSNPTSGGRVRGLGSGTLSRNFFKITNPTDNFNLERATVASGPNAILFGLGSPAGILDATPARAQMRNRYGFSLQYDSEESKRATFDANIVALPEKLAVRLMGMSKREYTMKRPNLDRDERLYGTITYRPFKNTTLILQGERTSRNWNRAGRIAPTEFVTPWLYADQIPGSGYTTPRPAFNNNTLTGIATNRIFTQASDAPVYIGGGAVPVMNWRNSVVVRNPASLPGVDPTFDASVDRSILDASIFPFDVNVVGNARTNLQGSYTKTVILEQKLATDLFLELAYNREDAFDHKVYAGGQAGSSNYQLRIDPNQFIPGTTTPNPYLGKFYFQGDSGNNPAFEERTDWRATLSYDLDLARKLHRHGAWTKWLGRHRWSALYTAGEAESLNQQNFDRRILDDPVLTGVTLRPRTFQNWATHSTRLPQYRHYFDTPYNPTPAAHPMTGDVSLLDSAGRPYTLYQYDTPLRAADGKRLGAGQVASGALNRTSATIFAWQGFFLPDREKRDRLVLTYGYRKDSAKSANLDAASTLQDFSGLFPVLWDARFGEYGPTQSGINRNIGVVARPLRWLTLFYNKSTTFDLNIGRYDPFGNDIPGAGGSGRDYGIRLDLWGDRVTLRLNKYENTLGPQRASNQINMLRDPFFDVENRVRTLDPGIATINIFDGNRRGYRVAGRPNYFIMSDSSAEGYEVELNVTPVRNWNIRINGSKSDSIESNIGKPWFEWGAQRLPVWESVVAKNGEVDAQGRPVTWSTAPFNATQPTGQTLAQYYQANVVGRAYAFISAADGRSTDTARNARANLITNYSFAGERLKGFNIGGAARWRAKPTIGYGVSTSAAGATVLDLDKAYLGEEEFYVDAILGYRGRFKAWGGFSYRLQLNVRNVLNDDDPIAVQTWTTGEVVKLATVEPRVLVLTFSVNF